MEHWTNIYGDGHSIFIMVPSIMIKRQYLIEHLIANGTIHWSFAERLVNPQH